MGEQGVEKKAQHTTLCNASVLCESGGGEIGGLLGSLTSNCKGMS